MSSGGMFERVGAAAEFIRRRCGGGPPGALILGPGPGGFADNVAGAVAHRVVALP